MNRDERAERAWRHTEKMQSEYGNEIRRCIEKSVIYDKNNMPDSCRQADIDAAVNTDKDTPEQKIGEIKNTEAAVVPLDTVSAAFNESDDKIAILNFASYTHPGGGFITGAMAQEEALCHESFLYDVLKEFPDFYDWNGRHRNRSLYLNRAIVTPDVRFFKDGKSKLCTVITCAAPNKRAAQGNRGVSDEEVSEVLTERIKFVMDIANSLGVTAFIAGAFGCGVFGNDPDEVGKLFIEESKNSKLSRLVFAVPPGRNLDAIQRQVPGVLMPSPACLSML